MHPEAFLYVEEVTAEIAGTTGLVVECGSRNVNGSVRQLFPLANYCGVDIEAGPDVDLVADFRTLVMLDEADVVICCEVLEHDPDPASLLAKAHQLLRAGGCLIMTCAGPDRPEHSAHDGGELRDGEHYANIRPTELKTWLRGQGWARFDIDVAGVDLRCMATK